jgi:O-antigen ligase
MLLKRYFFFTIIVGLVVGFFSMISDSLPYQDVTFYDTTIRFTAELLNDLAVWLGLSVLVGYLFCRSIKQAAFMGAGFAVFTIVIYFLFGLLGLDRELDIGNFAQHMIEWSLIAAAGGMIGGLIGFISRQYPSILLLYAVIVAWRLVMRWDAWQSPASALGNVVLIVIVLASVVYVAAKSARVRQAISSRRTQHRHQ